ncbi:MAG: penicillin-binding protein 1A [Rhodospirillales bacterium]|nr:penicillin-binding protein 1A [Rhodospirillales bacterium]
MIRFLATLFGMLLILVFIGAGAGLYVFYYFGRGLPEYHQLADYEPPVMTRVHAGDGQLLAEYAIEKRVFVPIKAMPRRVVNAFLSAEDKNFYSHPGVDILGVVRAVVTNLKNMGSSKRLVGASTITQQVAKNFLLSNELSWDRKVKEAILAFRIERTFTKDRILELYLNEIYLGFGSYGVAAAALNYFNKPLDELTVAEAAYLAVLPKAPNNYNPRKFPEQARSRRNWVISRMEEEKYITSTESAIALATPLIIQSRSETEFVAADYFSEEVRRELAKRYGESQLYKGGLSVRTTLDPRLQKIADSVVRSGLIEYDRRHGWRGPLSRLKNPGNLSSELKSVKLPAFLNWTPAAVLKVSKTDALIGFSDGSRGSIPLAELKWARPWAKDQKVGPSVNRPSDVLAVGDIIAVEKVTANAKEVAYPPDTYGLRQIPDIEGALIALDPHTGRVLAMTGGFNFAASQFNRATQALRQPGSAFKPFVYLAAIDSGFTPSTLVLDAPFVIDQGPGLPKWRPANYTKKFYGPSTMRLGIEKSRNLMTVRLAQTIGMDKISDYAERFGIVDKLPRTLSMSLGAGETTLMRLTTAYSMLVNGGKKITPTLIDRIQDRHGRTVFRHDERICANCRANYWTGQSVPAIPDNRETVTDPASAYQMVSMLQGVVQRGTGVKIQVVKKPLAGKTGTTNDSFDAWFLGFSPDLAVGVLGGFDNPRTLGTREQGASVAAPIFRDFMAAALEKKPAIPFRIPPGIRLVRVDAVSGKLAKPYDKKVILEAFKPGTEPTGKEEVVEGINAVAGSPATGTGGLY